MPGYSDKNVFHFNHENFLFMTGHRLGIVAYTNCKDMHFAKIKN